VRGERVVLYDRKKRVVTDEAGAFARLGVQPVQVPAFLALVGDTADGIPGVPRWGEKSAARVLAHYGTLAAIPREAAWDLNLRGAEALRLELVRLGDQVTLYEQLATLRLDVPLAESLTDLSYRGVDEQALRALCDELEMEPI
jgi:5'-3' exonuclease